MGGCYRDPVTISLGRSSPEPVPDPVDLRFERGLAIAVVNNDVRQPASLVTVNLGGDTGPGVLFAETPVLDQAIHRHVLGGVDHDHRPELEPVRGDDASRATSSTTI